MQVNIRQDETTGAWIVEYRIEGDKRGWIAIAHYGDYRSAMRRYRDFVRSQG